MEGVNHEGIPAGNSVNTLFDWTRVCSLSQFGVELLNNGVAMSEMKKPPASITMDNIHEARFPQTQETSSDNVLNLKEAAAVLHCHPKTLRLMARAHKIPAVRVGKLWRFSKERIKDWLEAS